MKKNGKVVVFGSFVTDLTSRSPRNPVPGETVMGTDFVTGPGGKGSNQGVAAHRCGADVTLVTKLGNDAFGKMALDFYQSEGMNTEFIFIDNVKPTGAALIMVDETSSQNMITVISGACGNFSNQDVEQCRSLIEGASILLLQMEINTDVLYAVIKIAHKAGVTVVLNTAPAAPIPDDILAMIDIVTPNETEALLLTGIEIKNVADAKSAAEYFFGKGVKQVVITLGKMGAYANDRQKDELINSLKVNAIDTTGAGDAFNGGFVTALSQGYDLFEALRYGNVTGALSVTKKGTAPSMPFKDQVKAFYDSNYGKQ